MTKLLPGNISSAGLQGLVHCNKEKDKQILTKYNSRLEVIQPIIRLNVVSLKGLTHSAPKDKQIFDFVTRVIGLRLLSLCSKVNFRVFVLGCPQSQVRKMGRSSL